ncbi:hypothetical protein ACH5RR_038009 [Cinchona calisaya]|uniref:Protein kinase domain-containing protein n=1 Tax=Cinchona calisaya TaxID=153742 RepID=A0ABD2YCK3_9GENT
MSDLRLLLLLFLFLPIMVSSAPWRFPMAKPGCNDTCGNNVTIPYPFGIGINCAINEAYNIICRASTTNNSRSNSSKPYLSKFDLEVLDVSLRYQTITLNTIVPQTCENDRRNDTLLNSTDLSGSPFLFSKEFNKFVLLGCGNALLNQKHDRQVLSGCTSMCKISSNVSGCYGINCCETSIPYYLTDYQLNFTISNFNNSCASAFLADESWKPERFSDPSIQRTLLSVPVPVVLSWTLKSYSLVQIPGCSPKENALEVESNANLSSWQCECELLGTLTWLYSINPYLDGACNYAYSEIMGRGKKNRTAAIVGASVGVGMIFLMITAFTLYKVVKKRRNKKRKEKFFKRNGGLLLQQQLSAEEGVIEKTMIFTAKELNKASDGFNENRILGQGGQGTVYKGMLTDGRIVAIKKSKKVDESQLEQFINEVVILSQVNHRNVVKLLGCCLETDVPLLVYEFISNGTLFSLIHNKNDDEVAFTWSLRLRIATEVAGALAYLHSAISIPIYHRDMKSSNILLDEKFIAKVSDFGISMSVAIDKTHLTTLVKGTFGYLDPEYFQSSQFTEKSDVYSFGVVLVELLTRQKAISSAGTGEAGNLSLATRFLVSMDQNSLKEILDPQILDQRNEREVTAVAKLAERCLNLNGKKRPTMKEVAIQLESIKMSSVKSTTQENFQSPSFMDGVSAVFSSDTNYTWTTETDSSTSATDAHPLLHTTV